MQYLNSTFNSRPSTNEYRSNWDATFKGEEMNEQEEKLNELKTQQPANLTDPVMNYLDALRLAYLIKAHLGELTFDAQVEVEFMEEYGSFCIVLGGKFCMDVENAKMLHNMFITPGSDVNVKMRELSGWTPSEIVWPGPSMCLPEMESDAEEKSNHYIWGPIPAPNTK